MHYNRWLQRGDPNDYGSRQRFTGTPEERFWRRVTKTSTCWLWTGRVNHHGYGMFDGGEGATPRAHRFSWELVHGPIPEGLQIDHRCHIPGECAGGSACIHRRCVNPAHLALATPRANSLRKIPHRPFKTVCLRGHPLSGDNLSFSADGVRRCRACGNIRAAKHRAKRRAERGH